MDLEYAVANSETLPSDMAPGVEDANAGGIVSCLDGENGSSMDQLSSEPQDYSAVSDAMIRILVADDHSIVRGGLKQLISTESGLVVAGEASQGSEVLARIKEGGIDLILLDMSMPGISGHDLIRRIHVEAPRIAIVILSMHKERQVVSRALKAGAAGYVSKDSDPAILLEAIRKVGGGHRFIDPCLVEAVVFGSPEDAPPHEVLSDREHQVLQCVCHGLTLAEAGDKLHISAKTVSTHKMRLMQKLNIDNNADLIRYGVRHGLIHD